MQAKAIRSLGCTAEAMTVGHNPYSKASAMDRSIVLPTTRHRLCCEVQLACCSLFPFNNPAIACLLHQLANQLVDTKAWQSIVMTHTTCHKKSYLTAHLVCREYVRTFKATTGTRFEGDHSDISPCLLAFRTAALWVCKIIWSHLSVRQLLILLDRAARMAWPGMVWWKG